jgi:signal transduction histidine kinase
MLTPHFKFLRSAYFFQDLTDAEIQTIAELSREESYTAGDVIFRETSRADKFYIVLDGKVEVWKDYDSIHRDILAVHGEGHLFGEMALIDDLPRSATIVARTGVRVLFLYRDDFIRVLRTNANVALSLLRSLSAMVRKSNDTFIEDLRSRNLELEEANRQLREAQEELLRAERLSNLGKFSSLILHDIRNPISIVKSYGEMLLMSADDPEKRDLYARNIIREAERLNFIASELLDYSRGEIRLNMSIVTMGDFLEKLRRYLSDRFASRNLRIVFHSTVTAPVIFDEERMLRVLINLSDNARKAMSPGGTLTVDVGHSNDLLTFAVRDTGEGMPPEILKRIFEPFFSSSRDGGTGLGMVIVKNIVEAHHGSLDVESGKGTGTVVHIRLPLRG